MLARIRTHMNPASLMALVALFVALGGVSYAAVKIDGKDLKKASVPGSKLVNGAVTNAKVKKGSLGADRLSANARSALKGNAGPQGPQGAQGPEGKAGAQGPAGTAVAYAQINDAPLELVEQRTSGIVSVSRPNTGLYCLTPSPEVLAQTFDDKGQPTRPTVASVEFGNTSTQTDQLIVETRGANNLCPVNTFEVHTYRNGADASSVAFTFIVP